MKVQDIMTRSPMTLEVTSTVRDAISIMHDNDIRHVPVVSEGELVGMVSDRDVKELTLPLEQALDTGDEQFARLSTPVGTITQGDFVSVHPTSNLTEAIDVMVENKVGAVPVVSPTEGSLVGIVSYVDVLGAAREFLS